MTRDLMNEDYYVSGGGQIPVKWTAPEVHAASVLCDQPFWRTKGVGGGLGGDQPPTF